MEFVDEGFHWGLNRCDLEAAGLSHGHDAEINDARTLERLRRLGSGLPFGLGFDDERFANLQRPYSLRQFDFFAHLRREYLLGKGLARYFLIYFWDGVLIVEMNDLQIITGDWLNPPMNYDDFIDSKTQLGGNHGFEPTFMPEFLFPFQKSLLEWSVKKGRSATMADCGLGKTALQLSWAQNIVQKTNKPVLILTPLAVGPQTVSEGAKFGVECKQSRDGSVNSKIVVTNYQQLIKFNPDDFSGVVCDESSILKNFDGAIKSQITDFMRKLKFRSLYTATAAPNDYIELGTSSEALGELGYMDMLARFFKNAQNSLHPSVYRHRGMDFNKLNESAKWRFRGHAERDFWRWVCSWARAVRKPSDLGFSDKGYILPKLVMNEHTIKARTKNLDFLFDMPAVGLSEQRSERSRTIQERCEMAAKLCTEHKGSSISWCFLNSEGDLLEKLIPDCVQISGNDEDELKEEKMAAFLSGQVKNLVSKSIMVGFGLNMQFCHHQTHFPSHSFEQWYQAVRRSYRFGQKENVIIDMITSEGESNVVKNFKRKEAAAEAMFANLVKLINDELKIEKKTNNKTQIKLPSWI
jgi:hypothetical protein